MKLVFVSVDGGIKSVGFRKMAAIARQLDPATEVLHVVPSAYGNVFKMLFSPSGLGGFDDKNICHMAAKLADADMVCFSSMTPFASTVERIIQELRKLNPITYVVWGGVHSIISPDDAIKHADAICVGEGETAFVQFFNAFRSGKDYSSTKNFWFKNGDKVVKNGFLPLHSGSDMNGFPYPLYADNELIFRKEVGFVPLEVDDYAVFNGLGYLTIWSIGCPFNCTYCGNSKFIENDSQYRKLRNSSVDYIIGEVLNAINRVPHIRSVFFADDCFAALPLETLEEFAVKWKAKVALPFTVTGVTPTIVKKSKMELLVNAGMIRVRMGIQSGSDRILDFYNRPNKPGLILKSAKILAEFKKDIIPPVYDIIVDNPIETRQDALDTLELLYIMPRPYSLNIFSLSIIPNTQMARDFAMAGIAYKEIEEGYSGVKPIFSNIMVYLLTVFRPPRRIFDAMLKRVMPFGEKQPLYPFMLFFFRAAYMLKRGFNNLRFADFTVVSIIFRTFSVSSPQLV